jgi:hypothetical protein
MDGLDKAIQRRPIRPTAKPALASKVARGPIDGAFRTWSDGRRVHLLVRFTGGNLGRGPVTMHATTQLVPARAAVRRRLARSGVSGDPVTVEALATRVGAFSAFRRIGRAARGAASLATAPVRALGGAAANTLRTTANLAKGVESATALTAFVTKPLGYRPGKKRKGPAAPAADDGQREADSKPPEEEEAAMTEETSGAAPKPQPGQVRKATALLRRARFSPKSARHVQNIAKAAAKGHPGAVVAQAAIKEARRSNRKTPAARLPALGPAPAAITALAVRAAAFPAWARGAV